jgi:hypothetical protein
MNKNVIVSQKMFKHVIVKMSVLQKMHTKKLEKDPNNLLLKLEKVREDNSRIFLNSL